MGLIYKAAMHMIRTDDDNGHEYRWLWVNLMDRIC